MKKLYITAIAIGAFLLMAATGTSVQAAQEKGDSALQVGGSFFHAQDADVGTLNLDLSYGKYISEIFEIGVIQSVGYSFIDDADDQWVASTIPFFNYHFLGMSDSNFQPFVCAFIGASYNEDDVTGTLGPQIGFNTFVSETTFISVKYRYEWFFEELEYDNIEDESSEGNHVVTLGVGFLF